MHAWIGTNSTAKKITELGLYIGISGCSLKSYDQCDAVRNIPLSSLLIETDCPFLNIYTSNVSWKLIKTRFPNRKPQKYKLNHSTFEDMLIRGRNEPCKVIQTAEIIASLKQIPVEEVGKVTFENSLRVF